MKPSFFGAIIYLMAGVLVVYPIFVLLSIVGFALSLKSAFSGSVSVDSTVLEISILFILLIVGILPLCVYLSRFWGKSKVFLTGIVVCAIITTLLATIRFQQLNNTEIIEITPRPVNVR